jgi:sarcosine oxidase subunit alpha
MIYSFTIIQERVMDNGLTNLRIKGIERGEKIHIIVNGKKIEAYEGETVASALWSAGYKRFRTSIKNRENRAPLCGMGVCYECLVTINGIPNIRSCMTIVRNGMEIETDE